MPITAVARPRIASQKALPPLSEEIASTISANRRLTTANTTSASTKNRRKKRVKSVQASSRTAPMLIRRSYATSVSRATRSSSRRTWVSAFPRRARFVASLSQPLAPDGCGSGIATASPST